MCRFVSLCVSLCMSVRYLLSITFVDIKFLCIFAVELGDIWTSFDHLLLNVDDSKCFPYVFHKQCNKLIINIDKILSRGTEEDIQFLESSLSFLQLRKVLVSWQMILTTEFNTQYNCPSLVIIWLFQEDMTKKKKTDIEFAPPKENYDGLRHQ